jgi:RNA polymerase sigma-70 factor (ECF subfamily)
MFRTGTGPTFESRQVEGCKGGHEEDFRTLFEAYKDRVFSLAFHFTGDAPLARDITQEVFLKVLSRIGEFRGQSQLTTWLYRIAVNVCVDEFRRRKRFVPLAQATNRHVTSPGSTQEEALVQRQTRQAVQAAVVRLRPKLRLTVILRYVEGLSYEEIAAAQGCSPSAVAARLNRSHRILARQLATLRRNTD